MGTVTLKKREYFFSWTLLIYQIAGNCHSHQFICHCLPVCCYFSHYHRLQYNTRFYTTRRNLYLPMWGWGYECDIVQILYRINTTLFLWYDHWKGSMWGHQTFYTRVCHDNFWRWGLRNQNIHLPGIHFRRENIDFATSRLGGYTTWADNHHDSLCSISSNFVYSFGWGMHVRRSYLKIWHSDNGLYLHTDLHNMMPTIFYRLIMSLYFLPANTIKLVIAPDSVPQGRNTSLQCQVGATNVTSYRFYAGTTPLCSYDVTASTGQCQDARHSILSNVMRISFAQLYEERNYTCQASIYDGKTMTSTPEELEVTPRE